jgi:hypothetical protein
VLLSGVGQEDIHGLFHGGTIFQDAASVIIWVEFQVSLGDRETIIAKMQFEEWIWETADAETEIFHC